MPRCSIFFNVLDERHNKRTGTSRLLISVLFLDCDLKRLDSNQKT